MSERMATKTFKCPKWVAAGINEIAVKEKVSDGEWIRRALIKSLEDAGYTAQDFDFFTGELKNRPDFKATTDINNY